MPSVHFDYKRRVAVDMPDEVCFMLGRQRVKPRLVKHPLVYIRVNREIAHAKRRQILEEMGALARIDTVAFKSALNYHACP